MNRTKVIITTLLALVLCFPTSAIQQIEPLDMQRIRQIAGFLPENPSGLGPTYKNRAFWDRLYESGAYDSAILKAEKMLKDGFPAWDQAKYDRVFTEGDTQSGKDVISGRMRAFSTLVWAECLENKDRFTPLIQSFMYDIMRQETWVNPRNYNKNNYGGLIELATASYSHNLAQAVYLLDDKLPHSVFEDVLKQLYQRAFNPLMETFAGKNNYHGWLRSTNNWNPVCLEGVVCSALIMIADRMERAVYVSIAEKYVPNYLEGFKEDGYCTEGVSYYNYGMSHYLVLREKVFQDTGGKIDLFGNSPKIQGIAAFPKNIEILSGIFPSIADCGANAQPLQSNPRYFNRALGINLSVDNKPDMGLTDNLTVQLLDVVMNLDNEVNSINTVASRPLRSFFAQSGILIVRSGAEDPRQIGVALKGGHNNEAHNHNDLGSYTLVVGRQKIVEDPGSIPYNIKTFGSERYTAFKSLGSYGHSVPLICGKDQISGSKAKAVITGKSFSEDRDELEMDIASAYDIPELKEIKRRFILDRKEPSFSVNDIFAFDSKQIFETAITTRSAVRIIDSDHIELERGGEKMMLTIRSSEKHLSISSEEISEGGAPYTRIAIRMQPAIQGFVTVTYNTAAPESL